MRFCHRLILLLCLCPLFARAQNHDRLLAEGTDARLWVATVAPAAEEGRTPTTTLFALEEGQWAQLTPIPAPVVDLAARGRTLIVALPDGTWWLGAVTGPPLPGKGRIVRVAAADEVIWAIASVPGGIEAARRAATTQPTTGPAPTTLPADPSLVLMEFAGGVWRPWTELPAELAGMEPSRLALAAVGELPVLAAHRQSGAIEVWGWTRAADWARLRSIAPPGEVADFDLLSAAGRAIVWVAPTEGPSVAYLPGDAQSPPVALAIPTDYAGVTGQAAAIAVERLRLVFRRGDRLYQQQFDLTTAKPVGEVQEVVAPSPPAQQLQWLHLIIMMALLLVLISTFRRRPNVEQTIRAAQSLPLAGLLLRFIAGLIDLLPFFAVEYFLRDPLAERELMPKVQLEVFVLFAGIAVYILHTAIAELLSDRTLGKAIVGLRVVAVDGSRPPRGSVFLRNVLRVVDVPLYFPLVIVLWSPLRQRIGDIAARTTVIRTRGLPAQPPPEN